MLANDALTSTAATAAASAIRSPIGRNGHRGALFSDAAAVAANYVLYAAKFSRLAGSARVEERYLRGARDVESEAAGGLRPLRTVDDSVGVAFCRDVSRVSVIPICYYYSMRDNMMCVGP